MQLTMRRTIRRVPRSWLSATVPVAQHAPPPRHTSTLFPLHPPPISRSTLDDDRLFAVVQLFLLSNYVRWVFAG